MDADKTKISRESAEDQIDLLFEEYDIDLDDPEYSEVDEDGDKLADVMMTQRRKLVKYIMRGRLEISDTDGKFVVRQILKRPFDDLSSIEYGQKLAKAKISMKSVKASDNYGRLYSFMGSLSGQGMHVFTKMSPADLSVAETLAAVFLLA